MKSVNSNIYQFFPTSFPFNRIVSSPLIVREEEEKTFKSPFHVHFSGLRIVSNARKMRNLFLNFYFHRFINQTVIKTLQCCSPH